jgi:ATP adenylyltransferase
LLVHPKKYAPQAESLTGADFDAAMQTMDRLGKSEWVAFYNCGIESGSSQPYRHVQIIPRPNSEEFLFFPDKYAQLASINKSARPTADIPFFCLLVGIAGENADIVYSLYEEMLARSESTLGHALVAHNAVFTTDWLCVIPRRRARIGICAANAMGMMGLIWVANQEERDVWDELGLSRRLSDFGYTPIRSKE